MHPSSGGRLIVKRELHQCTQRELLRITLTSGATPTAYAEGSFSNAVVHPTQGESLLRTQMPDRCEDWISVVVLYANRFAGGSPGYHGPVWLSKSTNRIHIVCTIQEKPNVKHCIKMSGLYGDLTDCMRSWRWWTRWFSASTHPVCLSYSHHSIQLNSFHFQSIVCNAHRECLCQVFDLCPTFACRCPIDGSPSNALREPLCDGYANN